MPLTPEVFAQLVSMFGPVGALALILWLNRPKAADKDDSHPMVQLVQRVEEMNARLIRVETILEERK